MSSGTRSRDGQSSFSATPRIHTSTIQRKNAVWNWYTDQSFVHACIGIIVRYLHGGANFHCVMSLLLAIRHEQQSRTRYLTVWRMNNMVDRYSYANTQKCKQRARRENTGIREQNKKNSVDSPSLVIQLIHFCVFLFVMIVCQP